MSVGGGATGAATIHAATHKVGNRGDEMLMRQTLINVLDNRGANSGLPPYLLRYLWLYKTTRVTVPTLRIPFRGDYTKLHSAFQYNFRQAPLWPKEWLYFGNSARIIAWPLT